MVGMAPIGRAQTAGDAGRSRDGAVGLLRAAGAGGGDGAPGTGGRLHPDRSFDTLACGGDGADARAGTCGGSLFCTRLAALELGSRCAVLSPDAARALVAAREADAGALDVRDTLALSAAGRVRVSPLRAWLGTCAAPHGVRAGEGGAARMRVVLNGGAGPYLCRPLQMGADAVVEDLRAWLPAAALRHAGLDGEGPCLAVACRGDRAWEELWAALGMDQRDGVLVLAPAADRLLAAGLATLSLRAQRASDTALVAAHYLAADPRVAWVSYPGLPEDAANDSARRTLEHGFGPLVAFGTTDAAPETADAPLADLLAVDCACTALSRGPRPGSAVVRTGLESPLDVVEALERFVGGLSNLVG